MIMLAKVVSYGGNSVRYALEKENAKTVKVNNAQRKANKICVSDVSCFTACDIKED